MDYDPLGHAAPHRIEWYGFPRSGPHRRSEWFEALLEGTRLEPSSAVAWSTDRSWYVPERSQPFSYLWIVLNGSGKVCLDTLDEPFCVEAGDAFVIPEQERHSVVPHEGSISDVLVFHFRLRYLEAVDLFALLDLRGRLPSPPPDRVGLGIRLCAAYVHRTPAWREYVAAGLRLLLIPSLQEAASRFDDSRELVTPPALRRLVPSFEYVRSHAGCAGMKVADMARAAGVSEAYLRKLFRECTGKTPQHFLLDVRLDRARDLLLHTNLTIRSVGSAVGLENTSYFHRVFRSRYGTSPGRYRRQPGV